MSWLSKGWGVITDVATGDISGALDTINGKDTSPQASPDPRVPNSAVTSGQVQAVNTGVNQTLGRKR